MARSVVVTDASTFLALDRGEPVGLVTVYRDTHDWTCAHLVSLWVSPDQRRHGVATTLTEAVLDWARLSDVQVVDLWVTENNEGARHLYERCGFVESGERQQLPSRPHLQEREMRRAIPG
jgi:ribosomal protein S18 acetylase RimI-like enzyme